MVRPTSYQAAFPAIEFSTVRNEQYFVRFEPSACHLDFSCLWPLADLAHQEPDKQHDAADRRQAPKTGEKPYSKRGPGLLLRRIGVVGASRGDGTRRAW